MSLDLARTPGEIAAAIAQERRLSVHALLTGAGPAVDAPRAQLVAELRASGMGFHAIDRWFGWTIGTSDRIARRAVPDRPEPTPAAAAARWDTEPDREPETRPQLAVAPEVAETSPRITADGPASRARTPGELR